MPSSLEPSKNRAESDGAAMSVDELQAQGASGLATLFERERPRLLRLFQTHLGDELARRIDDSDLVQDAFVIASKQLRSYLADPALPPYLWIRQVALGVIEKAKRTHLGTVKRTVTSEEDVEMSGLFVSFPSPRSQVVRHETMKLILAQIQTMRENDRRILELRHVEFLSLREISIVLDLGYNTVRKRYIRALERLRRAMKKAEEND